MTTETTETEVTKPELSDVEQKAVTQGWTPRDKYTGDPMLYKEAGAWLKDGERIDALRALQAEAAQLREMIATQTQNYNKLAERQQNMELERLKTMSKNAATAGDVEAVGQIAEKIAELKQEPKQTIPQANSHEIATAAVRDFELRNTWFRNPVTAEDFTKLGLVNKINAVVVSQYPNLPVPEQIKLVEMQFQNEYAKIAKPITTTTSQKILSDSKTEVKTKSSIDSLDSFHKNMISLIEKKKGSKMSDAEIKNYIDSISN